SGIDLAYLDPPYNQHSYRGNYHVWETLVRGDEPEAYGVAMKRVDCRTEKSEYNFKHRAWPALADLVARIDARYLLVSFNDEGFVAPAALRELLAERGEVGEVVVGHDRYVGARIGIHDPAGRKVGTVGHVRNREHLYLVGDGAAEIAAAAVTEESGDRSGLGPTLKARRRRPDEPACSPPGPAPATVRPGPAVP
ncbi:MAG: methyltransferase, partial [Thermoleophilia bacterium]|nr:methyltransferase [Thermoleophilia bacterium]